MVIRTMTFWIKILKNFNSAMQENSLKKYDDTMENCFEQATLSKSDFSKLSKFIYNQCGIKMPDAKRIMVEARLRKRLKDLQFDSYREYCEYLFLKKV